MPRVAPRRTRALFDARNTALMSLVLSSGVLLCLVNVVDLMEQVALHRQDRASDVIISVHSLTKNTSLTEDLSRRTESEAVSSPSSGPASHHGKERLLRILEDAGIRNISQETIKQLPTWSQVVQLYGDSPKIVGLDTCQRFREAVHPTERLLAPAGAFNSGTNLLAELSWSNCFIRKRLEKYHHYGIKWQVNWGKHQPPRLRLHHALDENVTNTNQLPVVAVRDPYSWMQSMCRHRYSAHWFHSPQHCPNLVPNEVDWKFLEFAPQYREMAEHHHNDVWLIDNVEDTANFTRNSSVIPVYVKYNPITTHHESLAHMWNDWYDEYLQADFPRLFVRMEDLVFHPKQVIRTVCECVGGEPMQSGFKYVTQSTKRGELHTNQYETALLDAMIRYGKLSEAEGMTQEDVVFARTALRSDMMELFGYGYADLR